ncbi:hypothetical protein QQ045_029983 [Rhodiola kirilowii]
MANGLDQFNFRNGSTELKFKTKSIETADDDDEELFEMLSRELSRSCSLLDHRPGFDISLQAARDLPYAVAEERFPSQHSFTNFQYQADQLRWMKMKQQQLEEMLMMRQMEMQMRQDMLEEQMIRYNQNAANRITRQNSLSPFDWPQKTKPQNINISNRPGRGDMRALFIGEPGPQKASAGTGVFLPRCPADQPKKPGFPTVLVPERVVQALNLNVERMQNVGRPRGHGNGNDACWI